MESIWRYQSTRIKSIRIPVFYFVFQLMILKIFIKIWPHSDFPLIPAGKIVLNKNPDNYFTDVEQIGFAPDHMIPGIEASPDKMLQVQILKNT